MQNAREAMGGRAGNLYIKARCRPRSASVEVSIRDEGPGIPPECHERIFEGVLHDERKRHGVGPCNCEA